ncbi:MAG: hypothetical protein DA408_10785 [Bacteroidetes bacterium]|nr:MAG: hypothetical protein C7N36_10240 [Bacteroidota bacterium]PTM12440.1 MAG: hypothetical protein DA408_10785 [Bacteroidota bacterium]
MSKQPSVVNRYSDQELQFFKEKIEAKLREAKDYQVSINEQIDNINETLSEEGDWMDDTASLTDLEMLQMMRHRQQKHIIDLENALQRIHNKSYGICIVSGELIDKKRLLAVPTTTKSLASKNLAATVNDRQTRDDDDDEDAPKPAVREKKEPVIITKVIRKVNPNAPDAGSLKVKDSFMDGDDDDDDGFDDLDMDLDDSDDLDDIDDSEGSKVTYVDPNELEESDMADDSYDDGL